MLVCSTGPSTKIDKFMAPGLMVQALGRGKNGENVFRHLY